MTSVRADDLRRKVQPRRKQSSNPERSDVAENPANCLDLALRILGRYYALDELPRDHQLQSWNVLWRNPDACPVTYFHKPASHGKTAGRLCGPDVLTFARWRSSQATAFLYSEAKGSMPVWRAHVIEEVIR